MPVEAFVDTNVLVYCVSAHPSEATKRAQAEALIAKTDFGTSAQVLAEFYSVVTRKIAHPISSDDAMRFIQALIRLPVLPIDADLVLEAIALEQLHQLSYWDAAIIAAAHRMQANTIYSEDLNDGQLYGKSRVINPFRTGK
jgi:predicted nucleic acid-binding protein